MKTLYDQLTEIIAALPDPGKAAFVVSPDLLSYLCAKHGVEPNNGHLDLGAVIVKESQMLTEWTAVRFCGNRVAGIYRGKPGDA
jgi:hypothetical protein